MLSYEVFMDYIKKNVLAVFPQEYADAEVDIKKVTKANMERYGMTFRVPDKNISPNLYLESYYADYKNGKTLDCIMEQIAADYQIAMMNCQVGDDVAGRLTDKEYVKNHVIFDLVGKAQNEAFIADVPNRDFLDLSIIYRVVISLDESGIMSTVVSNSIMDEIGMSEDELYQAAYKNTQSMYSPKVESLTEFIETVVGECPGECPLYMLTNHLRINGADLMIYDDALQALAKETVGETAWEEGDREIVILPSSRHEVLAVKKDDNIDIEYCQSMVQSINYSCVKLEDRLSNNLYMYDASTHTLTMATDVPNKRLDDAEYEKQKVI